MTSKRGVVALDPSPSWIVRAWKWGAGSLSACAALVSILSSVRAITGEQVRWIGVAPAADTAWSLGDTLQLATTITDGHGGLLPGVRVGWSSTDTAVASVDSGGAVVARAPGSATVVAAVGGRIAQSHIVVRPRAATIRILGDSLLRLPEDTTLRVIARVVDARGHQVPGQTIAWRSADPSVAAVDSAARVTAADGGRTTLVASSGDLAAELALEVYPVPASITVQAGDGQRTTVEHRLAMPVRAQVVSRGGRPLGGVAVRFAAADGGRLEPEADTSDSDGIVRTAWTLGARPGRQRLTLTVDGRAVGTTVTADADPSPEATRLDTVEAPVGAAAGDALVAPVAVRVTDTTGAPLPDVLVAWAVERGGSIGAEAPRTDSLGVARARWSLGPRAGIQRAFAIVGTGRAVQRLALEVTASSGAPASLSMTRSASVRAVAGELVTPAIELRVADRTGNPVPDVPVTLRVSSGTVGERAPVTDKTGRVSVTWTAGPTAGAQHLSASVEGIERHVEVTADVRGGPAAKLALSHTPAPAMAGQPLARLVEVAVTDAYGNAVSGAAVSFTSRSGKVVPARVHTDATGRAATRWVPGAVGEQRLDAAMAGSTLKASLTVRATAVAKARR
ncbi:MAG: Ig-like domain-containing protein [Gemmatimonadales bacterium]